MLDGDAVEGLYHAGEDGAAVEAEDGVKVTFGGRVAEVEVARDVLDGFLVVEGAAVVDRGGQVAEQVDAARLDFAEILGDEVLAGCGCCHWVSPFSSAPPFVPYYSNAVRACVRVKTNFFRALSWGYIQYRPRQ